MAALVVSEGLAAAVVAEQAAALAPAIGELPSRYDLTFKHFAFGNQPVPLEKFEYAARVK